MVNEADRKVIEYYIKGLEESQSRFLSILISLDKMIAEAKLTLT